MAKSIAAVFDRQDDAHSAAQELLKYGIAPERISVITGRNDEPATQEREVRGDQAVGAVAAGGGAALAGLTAFAIPAVGTVLAAGAAVAALSAALKAEDSDNDESHQM